MQCFQVGKLILCEGFGGKKIEGAHLRVFEPGSQDRQVISQRLATGSAGRQNNVCAGPGGIPGLGLITIELDNAACRQRLYQSGGQIGWKGSQVGGTRGSGLPGGEIGGSLGVGAPAGKNGIQGHFFRAGILTDRDG